MAAFNLAIECGADGIELDLHLSSDGVAVVLHDETLERTTDGRGEVGRHAWPYLRQLDAGRWFSPDFAGEPLPALEDVLKTIGGQVRLNLELKSFDAGVTVVELLKRHPDADIVLSSFDHDLLDRLRCLDKFLPIAVLFDKGNWRHALEFAIDLRACAFHVEAGAVSRPMIAACQRSALPVHVWTVDDVVLARSLFRAGAAGLFTNRPAALRRAFGPALRPI